MDSRLTARLADRVPALEVSGLDLHYGQVQALFDVCLRAWHGEVLVVLGTNAAGKTTLLRWISGLARADHGTLHLAGRSIEHVDAETRVGLGIVQVRGGQAVFPRLTVWENLQAGAYRFIWNPQLVRDRVGQVLELFPRLAERLRQRASTLSAGEQQMLGLAKGLLLAPRLLLIDELSLGLAPVVVEELLQVIERLKRDGVTIIVADQSVNIALAVADGVVFMEGGRIRFSGAASELLEREDLLRAVYIPWTTGR